MGEYERGDILKLSEAGLEHLYFYSVDESRKEKARQRRFIYQCESRKAQNCITVKRLPSGWYELYHRDFLEKE